MATKLFLTNNLATALSTAHYYMTTSTGGSGSTFTVVSSTSTGIQWTESTSGPNIMWVTGPQTSTTYTLTLTDAKIVAIENSMNANNGGAYRVFKISTSGVETELGGGIYQDGVEFGTSYTDMSWAGNVTDTSFSTGQRVGVKFYTIPVGTGASGFTCSFKVGGANGSTGDSFFNLNETVTFGVDAINYTSGPHTATATGVGSRVLAVSETRSATAVGTGSRVIQTQLGGRTATATGAVTHSESFVFTTVATATAIGVATGATLVTFGAVGTAVAVGVATGTAIVSYLVSALATAIGVTSHSESFIPAAGGGGDNDAGSALRRAGAWVAAIFRPGGLFE